jgi:hypothetical protein
VLVTPGIIASDHDLNGGYVHAVRAQMTYSHARVAPEDVVGALVATLGPDQPDEIQESPLLAPMLDVMAASLCYSHRTIDARVFCFHKYSNTLDVVVEPLVGDWDETFQSVHDAVRAALDTLGTPCSTEALVQRDLHTAALIRRGRAGILAELRRPEVKTPLVLAGITVLWIALNATFWVAAADRGDLVRGGFSTVASAVVIGVGAIWTARRGMIRWV